jgi:hypothetical protein
LALVAFGGPIVIEMEVTGIGVDGTGRGGLLRPVLGAVDEGVRKHLPKHIVSIVGLN